MLNPESTELFHNLKMNLAIPFIAFFLCIAIVLSACTNDSNSTYSPKVYDDSTSLKKAYSDNQRDFLDVALLLKDSNLFDYLYEIDRKSIFGPSIPKRDEYFTENEYQQLCRFLDLYRPYEIGKRNGYLFFVFFCINEDVVIYYTEEEGESLEYLLTYIGQNYDVVMLKQNWYIKISPSDIERIQK